MRKYLLFIIAIGTVGAFAESACADSRPIGKHEPEAVMAACAKVSGVPYWDKAGYGCVKENCDGKGGDCVVACSPNQNCYGSTPGRMTPSPGRYDLVKILKFSPRVPPGYGMLEPGQGGSPHGPSGVGTPKPAVPAPVLR